MRAAGAHRADGGMRDEHECGARLGVVWWGVAQLLQSEVPLNVSDSAQLLVERAAALVWLSEANAAKLGRWARTSDTR